MLEILNTVAAIGTFVVIGATAIAAVIQLRHMRASNQLEGLLNVLARVEDANFNAWMTETQRQLPQLLNDPDYVRSVVENTFDRNVAWLQLGNSYDWVGSLVKNRLIPEEAFMDVYAFRIVEAWKLMEPITVIARHNVSEAVWENFEYLYVRGLEWATRHGAGTFPKRVRRAKLPDFHDVVPPGYSEPSSERFAGIPEKIG
jgi:hypothetical protein